MSGKVRGQKASVSPAVVVINDDSDSSSSSDMFFQSDSSVFLDSSESNESLVHYPIDDDSSWTDEDDYL